MSLNFFLKTETAFGLDVGGNSLKLMQLQRQGGGLHIRGYSEVATPKSLTVNDAIADPKTFAFLLKQALDKPAFGRIDARHAVVSLPEAKSFVRVIQIPAMSEAEAENAVPFEAENFIPLPIDQVYLDWQVLQRQNDKLDVLIIATPRDFADKFLGVLDKAGIKAAALEVESQSCLRALLSPQSHDSELLVDLDAFRSSLIIEENGNLQFTSSIPLAGNAFSDAIAKNLGVSLAKAEEIKYKVGIDNTPDYPNIKTALLPVLANLGAEIKNILKFHSEHSQNKIAKIVLVGGSAKLKNLAEFLQPQISDFADIPVELGKPLQNLIAAEKVLDPYQALGYTTAIGLAMRGTGSR